MWLGAAVFMKETRVENPVPTPPRPEDFAGGRDMPLAAQPKGWVTFTFDDGPNSKFTPRILDALAAHHIPATFFVVAKRFTKRSRAWRTNRKLLNRIIQDGHAVGNHTFNHRDLRRMRRKRMKKEVSTAEALLKGFLGSRPYLFRPPFGRITEAGRRTLRKEKYTIAKWNIDTVDYRAKNREKLRDRTLREILKKEGGIVLFHDTKEITADVLPEVLEHLFQTNCERIDSGENPIIPVSLHYFLANQDGTQRKIPEDIQLQTKTYRRWLDASCEFRESPFPTIPVEDEGQPT